MANNVDPDQTAPTQFAKTHLSKNLRIIMVYLRRNIYIYFFLLKYQQSLRITSRCKRKTTLAQVIVIFNRLGYCSNKRYLMKWARSCENVSYVICEQQRYRSACTSAQSDQHLCCLLLR